MNRYRSALLILSLLSLTACSPRVIVATGTTIGIKATPGDGQTRPPQVVIGYKRAETALIPVEGGGASRDAKTDAASTVASFYLKSEWTAGTEIRSFIGTGFAARTLVGDGGDEFKEAFAKATGMRPSKEIQTRQAALLAKWSALSADETNAQNVLDRARLPRKPNKNAVDSLHEYIVRARTEPQVDVLEKAFPAP